MAIKTLKQTPYQWLYNPIIEIATIGYVIEMLECYKNVEIPTTNTVSVCYYIS